MFSYFGVDPASQASRLCEISSGQLREKRVQLYILNFFNY